MPRISRGPALSMPKGLTMPKAVGKRSRPAGSKSAVKPPKFLADLYADLRDRRLLPLVALLIVGIIAAPILLGNRGGDDEAAAPGSVPPGAETTDSAFTVVPTESGQLRSPGKRLGHRQALNPFRQPGAATAGTEREEVEAIIGGATGSTSSSGGSPAAEISPVESSGVEAPPIETSPIESLPEESGSIEPAPVESAPPPAAEPAESATTTKTESNTNVVVQHQVVGYEIDLKTGFPPEKLEEQTEVAPLTKLPDRKHPVLLFVGLSKDKNRALFLMTSQVTAYYGAAHCALDKQACQLVELKPGKSASFSYGYGKSAAVYKLFLKKIEPVVKTHEAEATEVSTETEHKKSKTREPGSVAVEKEPEDGEAESVTKESGSEK